MKNAIKRVTDNNNGAAKNGAVHSSAVSNSDDGFTLVEVVVSLALFVIVAGSATFAIVSAMRASTATDLRVAAGYVAQQEIDRLRALGPNPIVADRPASSARSFISDGREYELTVTATPAWNVGCAFETTSGFRDVTVQVDIADGRIGPVYLDTRLACSVTP